jgi:hypothetical protein
LRDFLLFLSTLAVISLVLAGGLLTLAIHHLRRIKVPPGADFFTAIRAVPLSLVVGIDLLDLGLEVFSAPLIWFLLNRTGLQALRKTATIEALIPFSGAVPTLTLAWIAARLFGLGQPYDPNVIETERIGPNEWVPRSR